MSIFTKVQMRKPNYSSFDLSHQKKLSGKMGQLIPILAIDTVPGDRFKLTSAQMLRMSPMLAPLMHQVTVYTHFFFVPNRILWDGWEDFITGGEDGTDTTVPPTITLASGNVTIGSLPDYFGIPPVTNTITGINALPFGAYFKIYNEYFRDQNLINAKEDALQDGVQTSTFRAQCFAEPLPRAWQHDYFTSALPWTQKGPEATVPLGSVAPIIAYDIPDAPVVKNLSTGVAIPSAGTFSSDFVGELTVGGTKAYFDFEESVYADLSQATASTINELRRAFKLQEWLEKNARGGSRYIESILAHFGVRSSDARLQRPEFLGGGSVPISISEVLQTSSTDATTPQGNMSGHGVSVGQNAEINYFCEEHGWIIGIMSVMPKTAYQDGIAKKWLRTDKFDYYWPEFAHIGEQPIHKVEVFANYDQAPKDTTWGYTPRYAEYKYENDTVHGEFRTTLDFWHLGRKFSTEPALNEDFINCVPDERIFAVEGTEHFYAQVYHNIKASRPMPFFGTPKL